MPEQITFKRFYGFPLVPQENQSIDGAVYVHAGETPPPVITHDIAVWMYASQFVDEVQAEYRQKFSLMSERELVNHMHEVEGVGFSHVAWIEESIAPMFEFWAKSWKNESMSDGTHDTIAERWGRLLLEHATYVCAMPQPEDFNA